MGATVIPAIPDAIRELCSRHVERVAEVIVAADLEPLWISFDQLLQMRLFMIRLQNEPETIEDVHRLRGAVDELNALRDAIKREIEHQVAEQKAGGEEPREALQNARRWLGELTGGSAGPVG